MFKALAIFNGILIGIMISLNGLLAKEIGNYTSLIVIHAVALGISIIMLLVKKGKFKSLKSIPFYLFLGGFIGTLNLTMNNLSIVHIGVSLTISICIVGQLIGSTVIDHYGFLKDTRNKINIKKFIGILIMICGIAVMTVI